MNFTSPGSMTILNSKYIVQTISSKHIRIVQNEYFEFFIEHAIESDEILLVVHIPARIAIQMLQNTAFPSILLEAFQNIINRFKI